MFKISLILVIMVAAGSVELQNDKISVQIDSSSGAWKNLHDHLSGQSFAFDSVAPFELQLSSSTGAKTLSPAALSFLGVSGGASTARARWSGLGFNVSLDYEVRKGWRFTTVRLQLQALSGAAHTTMVNSMTLLNANVSGCDFESAWHQSPGAFLR